MPEKIQKLKALDEQLDHVKCNLKIFSDHGASLAFFGDYKFTILGALAKDHGSDLSIKELQSLKVLMDPSVVFVKETGSSKPPFKIEKVIQVNEISTFDGLVKLAEDVLQLCK